MGMPPDLNIVVFVKQEHFEAFHMKKLPLLYNIAAGTGDIYEVYVSSLKIIKQWKISGLPAL